MDRIASGGMGEVFRAHDAVLAREVAIKVLHRTLAGDPGFIDRFRREARAAASLSHPNIVAVHDWGAVDGIYFMVMEFIRGRSVRELLSASGRLEPAQAADVLLQVLSALDHAHRQGIVHRDIKPENVIVTPHGVAKVADFGLARAYADSTVTHAGTVTGTVQYLAPEQIQGEPADPRTDLYSLGIVAFELLTGRVPFTGETSLAIAYKHLRDRVPPPSRLAPAVPEGLDGWVAAMTEKERELRPESAAEARRDLANEAAALAPARPVADLVGDLPVVLPEAEPEHATTVTIPRALSPRARKRRKRRLVAGAVLGLVALLGAAWGVWAYLVPHYVRVPSVTGMPVEAAQARLEGLVVKVGRGEYSMRYEAGEVVRVEPPPGTELRTGTRVTLVPSLGPPPVEVPDLLGLTVPQAKKALAEADLSLGDQKRAYSDEYRAGQIMAVQAGPTAPRGSEVDVTVSRGPRPIHVPKVVGLPEKKARAVLTEARFQVTKETAYSDTVERGFVIGQEPAAKDLLAPGQAVTITVSLGPETFELPSFVGMSRAEAVAAIRALGLVPAVLQVPGSTGDTVASQLPTAGTTVRAGQTITIYLL
ncbi:MAG: Stk1 family PASTA domain-containing Ser/Thr kinase [Actinobacteria bacterium]|nr:Stk1 family PASTA domain-containing Ser/Thr kinase [Actinomycetota bacterium]